MLTAVVMAVVGGGAGLLALEEVGEELLAVKSAGGGDRRSGNGEDDLTGVHFDNGVRDVDLFLETGTIVVKKRNE